MTNYFNFLLGGALIVGVLSLLFNGIILIKSALKENNNIPPKPSPIINTPVAEKEYVSTY